MARASFREDGHAGAGYRRDVARTLTLRALRRAIERARTAAPVEVPRLRPSLPQRPPAALAYFTSGRVDLTVNGQPRHAEGEARTTLLDLLRREGLWGVKHGCETGECGACAVLLDGRPVNACLTLALRAQGRAVQTVEGLGSPDSLHPVQQAFVDTGAVQCGYCTPGHGAVRPGPAGRGPRSHRGRGPRRPGRVPVPLHGLRQAGAGGAAGGAGGEGTRDGEHAVTAGITAARASPSERSHATTGLTA